MAREANVLVLNKAFAKELRTDILKTIADGATHISTEKWQRRRLLGRFASWLAYGGLRLFLGVIGYADER